VEQLLKELKHKIVSELGLIDITPESIADDEPFFDDGLELDSVDILELVVLMDRDYGITIDNRELGEKVFITIRTMAEHIATHRNDMA
jgi:acyl carrier protein